MGRDFLDTLYIMLYLDSSDQLQVAMAFANWEYLEVAHVATACRVAPLIVAVE